MKPSHLWRYFIATIILLDLNAAFAASAKIAVKIRVTVPRHFYDTPAIYLGGDTPELGNWNAQGIKLTILSPGILQAEFRVNSDEPVSYKYSLGDWQEPEVLQNGAFRPDRLLSCARDCTFFDRIENFQLRDGTVHPVPKTALSSVHYHHDVFAEAFGNFRTVAVYLPPNYGRHKDARYPVLYSLDGQNLFDAATASFANEWHMDETAEEMMRKGSIPETIIVGIYATKERTAEYNYCAEGSQIARDDGRADAFSDFLTEKLKPWIDAKYRTLGDREHTMLLGSSFGGNFTFLNAWAKSRVFSRFGVVSPAFWWNDYCLEHLFRDSPSAMPARVWIDTGDREGWDDGAPVEFRDSPRDVSNAFAGFVHLGLQPESEVTKFIEPGATHCEVAWSARLPKIFSFLLR